MNEWLLDDGLLAGSREDLRKAVEIILEGPQCGLQLSTERNVSIPGTSKCALWCPQDTSGNMDPLGHGIQPMLEKGFVHLGSPVGDPYFVQDKVKESLQGGHLLNFKCV